MTTSPPLPLQRGVTSEPGEVEDELGCSVCDHPRADHDAIGTRYCQATQAQAMSRNCICRYL